MSTDRGGSPAGAAGDRLRRGPPDFSLVLGGPLYQMLRRAHLTDDALMLQRRRILVISLVAWLPLLVLAAMGGQLLGGGVAVPFLMDVDVHVKFLLVVPLLILAELVVHQRMQAVTRTFLERDLVAEADMQRLDAAVASAYRLRNSVTAEALLLAFVYVVGVTIIWRQYNILDAATWYATPAGDGSNLTLAGVWYGYVSLPIFQFLLCRWYFRIFIWTRLLWQVSRIELQLVPTHPDRVGGLGFLAATSHAFIPLLMAHGALLAGNLANQIFHAGAILTQFRLEILLLVLFMVVLVVGPLLVFGPQLARARRTGLREYGTLAQRYVRNFDAKWVRGDGETDEPHARQRGHPVPRRPRQQLCGHPGHAHGAGHQAGDVPAGRRDACSAGAAAADPDAAGGTAQEAVRDPLLGLLRARIAQLEAHSRNFGGALGGFRGSSSRRRDVPGSVRLRKWWARWDSNPGPRDSRFPEVSLGRGLSLHPRPHAGRVREAEPVIKGTTALR